MIDLEVFAKQWDKILTPPEDGKVDFWHSLRPSLQALMAEVTALRAANTPTAEVLQALAAKLEATASDPDIDQTADMEERGYVRGLTEAVYVIDEARKALT